LQSVKKLFHKDSLNKAKVPENLKLANAQHYDKPFTDEYFMKKFEAEMAFDKGEIPLGLLLSSMIE
jgi:hypothetical protein